MSLPNIYPIHDQVLVQEKPDSLQEIGFLPSDLQTVRGVVVRIGLGMPTRHGLIPPVLRVGDDILFMSEVSIKFQYEGRSYYLTSEWTTSGVLNRDPQVIPAEIPQMDFPGLDIDALMDRIEAEELALKPKDPDGSSE